ncbi:MAG: hypothetical protein IPN73_14785 [Saprospiraceae bacterium]|nr:hypothetical protein [Saprospiraceae bacterium]MBK7790331.1 hypothetical protein [Saprospiraceae bacterium]MBK8112263.1 hypothetical protein [Saprospiraceae bacterium]MBK8851396.1 hypothetical protein [Saprospiraceae bacterium]MBL0084953.1 hypothetical protein [Saprospiraceae bacterium]
MKKNLLLSVSLIGLFTLSLISKSLYAQVTVDESKNVLVGSGSPAAVLSPKPNPQEALP